MRGVLTDREVAILELTAQGRADAEVAERLGIRLATVRAYWQRIRHKCGLATRQQILARYLASGRVGEDGRLEAEGWLRALCTLLGFRVTIVGRDGDICFYHDLTDAEIAVPRRYANIHEIAVPCQQGKLDELLHAACVERRTVRAHLRVMGRSGAQEELLVLASPVSGGEDEDLAILVSQKVSPE